MMMNTNRVMMTTTKDDESCDNDHYDDVKKQRRNINDNMLMIIVKMILNMLKMKIAHTMLTTTVSNMKYSNCSPNYILPHLILHSQCPEPLAPFYSVNLLYAWYYIPDICWVLFIIRCENSSPVYTNINLPPHRVCGRNYTPWPD